MGVYTIKPAFQETLTPLRNLFVHYKIHPTIINFLGLFFSLLIGGILYIYQTHLMLLLCIPFLAFFRTACNALDGLVSRELHIASAFGEVLNEFIDRVSDVIIFLSLGFSGSVTVTLASVTTIIILLNSYVGILSKAAGGSRQYGGLIGKADRMIYLSIAAVFFFFFASPLIWIILYIFLLLGTLISIQQRFVAIKNELQ